MRIQLITSRILRHSQPASFDPADQVVIIADQLNPIYPIVWKIGSPTHWFSRKFRKKGKKGIPKPCKADKF
ncbi:MAG: hypothetical protein IPM81_17065 [Saprospirales bacterium]|nr:hypothetical protein [Saprospirales bacterium]